MVLQEHSRSAKESTKRSNPQNAPFLQRPFQTLSKVDLGFLKGITPPTKPDSSDREKANSWHGWAVSKWGDFESRAVTRANLSRDRFEFICDGSVVRLVNEDGYRTVFCHLDFRGTI
jgi:hypothetical protein